MELSPRSSKRSGINCTPLDKDRIDANSIWLGMRGCYHPYVRLEI